MRILILWRRGSKEMRNTIADHAFSFCKYDLENEYFYFDVYNGRFQKTLKDSRLSQIVRESCDKNNQQVYREMVIL